MTNNCDMSGLTALSSRLASSAREQRSRKTGHLPTERYDKALANVAAGQELDHDLRRWPAGASGPHRHHENQSIFDRPARLSHQTAISQSTVKRSFGDLKCERDGKLGFNEHITYLAASFRRSARGQSPNGGAVKVRLDNSYRRD